MILIEPVRPLRLLDLRELWAYRELALALCLRDLKLKYRQTYIGVAWGVLKPVLTLLVFTFVFGHVAGVDSGEHAYAVFLFAALLPWQLFSAALGAAASSVLAQQDLITQVYFPRLVVPLAAIGACLADLLVALGVLAVVMTLGAVAPTPALMLLPVLLLPVLLAALGVGLLVAGLSVAYRDLVHLLPFGLQLWLFLTPVVYGHEAVPERWQWLLALNPMAGLVEACRASVLGQSIDVAALITSTGAALVLLMLGVVVFERCSRRFADVI